VNQKPNDFSVQKAMQFAKSPAGQQLIAMLQQADHSQIQQAMSQASSGDYNNAQKTLSQILSSPEAQKLLKQLGE
jgi:hypothetical protein